MCTRANFDVSQKSVKAFESGPTNETKVEGRIGWMRRRGLFGYTATLYISVCMILKEDKSPKRRLWPKITFEVMKRVCAKVGRSFFFRSSRVLFFSVIRVINDNSIVTPWHGRAS